MGYYWSNGHLESTGRLMKLSLLLTCLLEMRITRIKNHIKEIDKELDVILEVIENEKDNSDYSSDITAVRKLG